MSLGRGAAATPTVHGTESPAWHRRQQALRSRLLLLQLLQHAIKMLATVTEKDTMRSMCCGAAGCVPR